MKDDNTPVQCGQCGEEYIPCCFCGEGPNGPSHGADYTHSYQEHAHVCEDPNVVEGLHAMDCAGWLQSLRSMTEKARKPSRGSERSMWVINTEGGLWVHNPHEPQQFVVSKQRHDTEQDTMRNERDSDNNSITDNSPVPTHAKCPMCGKTVNVTIRGEYAGHPRDKWYTLNDAGTELTGECPATGASALDSAVEIAAAVMRVAAERTGVAKAACAQANMRLEDALNVEARARNRHAALELLRAKRS